MRNLVIVILVKYYLGDQLVKVEMGGKCGMHGGCERCIQVFGEGNRPLGRTRHRREGNIKTDFN
jgi:hypothetical protein